MKALPLTVILLLLLTGSGLKAGAFLKKRSLK